MLVVSTGRTGTKALAQHLNEAYEGVLALHEPPPTRFRLRRTANRYLCGRLSARRLARVLSVERRAMGAHPECALYIESNPGLAGFLDVFGQVFADFQVLHVVRDPRTYIPSALDWGVFRGVRRVLAEYLPFWLPKPDYRNPRGALRWKRMSHVARLAWYWTLINEHLDRASLLYPDRYMRVTYEDLFARDGSGLARFAEWIGLPPSARLVASANRANVNASKRRASSRWVNWSAGDRQAVLDLCGRQMERYGYDVTGECGRSDTVIGETQGATGIEPEPAEAGRR